jgi:hypothetical protein
MPKTVYATGDIPTAANFNAFTQEANAAITGGTIGGVTSVGVGVATASVTAKVHIAAGSATAGTAPVKFTAGPLMTVVEQGAIEYAGHTFYATTYRVRRSIALAQGIPIARVQVPASSTTKTLVYSCVMAANYLAAGKKINMRMNGTITQRSNLAAFFTITLENAGGVLLSWTTPASTAMAALAFELDLRTVCRSIGVTGSTISYGKFSTSGTANSGVMGTVTTVDTTADSTLYVYMTANENNAGTGPVNVEMAETICVDANT